MSRNRRAASRQPFHQSAFIDPGEGLPSQACTVADISKTGARISVEAAIGPPDEFSLVLTHNGSVRRHCRVTWRADRDIGVVFVPAPKAFHASPMSIAAVADGGAEVFEPAEMVNLDT